MSISRPRLLPRLNDHISSLVYGTYSPLGELIRLLNIAKRREVTAIIDTGAVNWHAYSKLDDEPSCRRFVSSATTRWARSSAEVNHSLYLHPRLRFHLCPHHRRKSTDRPALPPHAGAYGKICLGRHHIISTGGSRKVDAKSALRKIHHYGQLHCQHLVQVCEVIVNDRRPSSLANSAPAANHSTTLLKNGRSPDYNPLRLAESRRGRSTWEEACEPRCKTGERATR
jgi:hypothetical protein